MSSSLCFLCHSTVNSETKEDIRDKFKEVVGMHLSPNLCHVCCHMVRKLYHFRATCLKRSLEYPVLFSEKGTLNLQKNDLENIAICLEDDCRPPQVPTTNFYVNSRLIYLRLDHYDEDDNTRHDESNLGHNQYVDLEYSRTNMEAETEYFNAVEQENDTENQDRGLKVEIQENFYREDTDCDNYEESNEFTEEINGFNEGSGETPLLSDGSVTNTECRDIKEAPDENHEMIEQDVGNSQEDELSSKKKHKKKKRSFEKIVLTFQEQKAVLEAQRRDKKYLEAKFKCHSCALGFLFQDTYQSHMVRHEESNGQFNCSVCGLRFATQNARAMHVNLHAEIYRCNRCSAEVKRPHRSRHSRDCWRTTDTASCHLCGKEFKDGNCLQQHLRRFHATKSSNRVYPCSVCGKTYPDPGVLRTHMIKHLNCRFACAVCPASFASPYSLNRHKRRHGPDARNCPDVPFHCAVCGTSYETKKSLAAHLKNTLKHQQMSFECALCPRKFPTNHALRRHADTHARAPRDCALCGARCKSRAALQRHTRAHTARPTVNVCHICGKGFKCKSKLNRHVREVCEKSKLEEEMASFYEQETIVEQINAVMGT